MPEYVLTFNQPGSPANLRPTELCLKDISWCECKKVFQAKDDEDAEEHAQMILLLDGVLIIKGDLDEITIVQRQKIKLSKVALKGR